MYREASNPYGGLGGFSFGEKEIKMPLTKKGKKIKRSMMAHYGKKKGKQVFYASENKGNIKGVTK